MRLTILVHSFFWILAAGLHAQDHASLSGTITDQGKPASDAFISLKGLRDDDCVRLSDKQDRSAKEDEAYAACESELGRGVPDDKGSYSFPDLKPGWHNLLLLFSMAATPASPYVSVYSSMMCPTREWGVMILSPTRARGKYNGFAQSVIFYLKNNQARRINFNYEKKIAENPACDVQGISISDPGKDTQTQGLVMSIPGTKGSLSLMPGATEWKISFSTEENQVFLDAKGRSDHLLVTAFLQKVAFEATAASCREFRWHDSNDRISKQPTLRRDAPQLSMKDGFAMVEFTMLEFQGQKVMSRNIHAYRGGGHTCAEIHLSKVQFQPEDRKLFEEVLATVKFVPE